MEKHHWEGSVIDITPQRLQIRWLCVFLFFLFLSCSNKLIVDKAIKIKGFDSREWKKDSLSCKNIRPDLAKILIENKSDLMRLNRNQILSLLGKPNGDRYKTFGYFIENGTQCLSIDKKSFSDVQTKLLLIEFKSDSVNDVYIINP